MPSPFPGMDPFLEAHWGDVHLRLATSISNELRRQLPSGLKARLESSVVLETVDPETFDPIENDALVIYPDIGIYAINRRIPGFDTEPTAVAVAEPQLVEPRRVPRTPIG